MAASHPNSIIKQAKKLREISNGFRPARVLLTANNYRVFDHLEKPRSVSTISKRLGTDLRATEILLDALTGLGLLKKRDKNYSNSPIASRFLVSSSPYYQGDYLRHADNHWKNWSGLDEVIKTGSPFHIAHNRDAFIRGMHNLASLRAKKIISLIGLKGIQTALDLGGGPGTYSIEMAKKGIHVTLFDRPETIEIAKGVFKMTDVKDIIFIGGDFLFDDIGKGYDLIFISQVLHSLSEKDNIQLLRKCRRALNKRGRIIIQEAYLSDDRTYPLKSTLSSVNMLINTVAGRCYSHDEIKGWFRKTGLRDIREKIIDDSVLISGRLP